MDGTYLKGKSMSSAEKKITLTRKEVAAMADKNHRSGYDAGFEDGRQAGYDHGSANTYGQAKKEMRQRYLSDEMTAKSRVMKHTPDEKAEYQRGIEWGKNIASQESHEEGFRLGRKGAIADLKALYQQPFVDQWGIKHD